MNDTRLNTAVELLTTANPGDAPRCLALLDDARCLLVDIVDERAAGVPLRDFNILDAARQLINVAVVYVQTGDGANANEFIAAAVEYVNAAGGSDA